MMAAMERYLLAIEPTLAARVVAGAQRLEERPLETGGIADI